jgi:hypothetical protein
VAVVSNIEELTDSTGSALIKDFFDWKTSEMLIHNSDMKS